MGQAQLLAAGGGYSLQLLRFGQRKRHGLVQDDVEAAFQRQFGGSEVQVVGRDDGNNLHALRLGPQLFLLNEFLIGAVHAVGRQAQEYARGVGFFGVAAEGPGGELIQAVEGRRHAVDGSDEGPLPTANHGQS